MKLDVKNTIRKDDLIMKPKVFLSAGHGGSDPGAVAYGMKEKDINLNIMLACNDILVKHGVTTVLSRIKDENDPVAQEVREANASEADIAVSFHTNAGKGDGSETWYSKGSKKGEHLAELCEKHVKTIGQNSRGVKPSTNLWFVKATTMPAVICECAFIDNDVDNNIIDTIEEQKTFGLAYAKAILEYFDIDYVEDKPVSWTVQVGAFSNKENAIKRCAEIKAAGFEAFVKAK